MVLSLMWVNELPLGVLMTSSVYDLIPPFDVGTST